jgi:bilirubin oxidase
MAAFYLLRGGNLDDQVSRLLPGPAPAAGDSATSSYHETRSRSGIVFQRRWFALLPGRPRVFEGSSADLQIPFLPGQTCDGRPSDVSPIWNPEFFSGTMVNGNTWPFLDVECAAIGSGS